MRYLNKTEFSHVVFYDIILGIRWTLQFPLIFLKNPISSFFSTHGTKVYILLKIYFLYLGFCM